MTDSTSTISPLSVRVATLERENSELRDEAERWRRKATSKEALLVKYQKAGARRAD